MTTLVKLTISQSQKENTVNNNFSVIEQCGVFGNNPSTTSGLIFGYYGGWFQRSNGNIVFIEDGTLTLSANITNYIEYNPSTNIINSNTSGFTTGYVPLYQLITNTTKIISSIPLSNKRSVFYAMHNTSISPVIQDTTLFAERSSNHSGLNWAYYGGNYYIYNGTIFNFTNSNIAVTNSVNNYIFCLINNGSIYTNTTNFSIGSIKISKVSATGGSITATIDKRAKQYQQYGVSPLLTLSQHGYTGKVLCNMGSVYDISQQLYQIEDGGFFTGPFYHSGSNSGFVRYTPGLFDGRTQQDSTGLNNSSPPAATSGFYYLRRAAPTSFLTTRNTIIPNTTDDVILLYKSTSTNVAGNFRLDTLTDYRKVLHLRRYTGRYYEGSDDTITADTTYSKTHGLILASGIKEIEWEILLYCKTAELGYAIGDEVKFMTGPTVLTAADPARKTGKINATTLSCRICEAIYVQHGTASTYNAITLANWGLRFRARITQ